MRFADASLQSGYDAQTQKNDEVLELPPKIRSWVPVDISDAPSALSVIEGFLDWYHVI